MKKGKILLLNIATLAVFTTPLVIAAGCDKTQPKKQQDEKPKPQSGNNTGSSTITPANPSSGNNSNNEPTPESKTTPINTNKADDFANEIADSFVLKPENSRLFHESIANANKYKFVYGYIAKKIFAFLKNEKNDYEDTSKMIVDFNHNKSSNYEIVNAESPLQKNGKLNTYLNIKVDENKNIILSYRGAIYSNTTPIISAKVYTVNLGKLKSTEELVTEEEINSKAAEVQFGYPNIENTLVSEANLDLITKTVPEGYELSVFKPAINVETNDITIIYKLKKINTEIENAKNQFKVISGWKKSSTQLENENKAKAKIQAELDKSIVQYLNEKAYQDVLKNNQINNFENKPNFVISNYETSLYIPTLENLVREGDFVKVTLKLTSISDNQISLSKEIIVSNEYSKGINPHSMTAEEQNNYLKAALAGSSIYPYYSKDKTYIESLQNDKLTRKSFWINGYNNSLVYTIGDVIKENENYKVNVSVKFADWDESPEQSSVVNIDIEKLGIEEVNKKRAEENKEPLEDQYAAEKTIDEGDKLNKVELKNYQPTPEDEYGLDNPNNIVYKTILENVKKSKISILSREIEEQIIQNKDAILLPQSFNYDIEQSKLINSIYFVFKNKSFYDIQNVFILSNPIIENDKVKSVKLSLVGLQDAKSGAYDRQVSTRVEVLDEYGQDMLDKMLLTYKFKELIGTPTFSYENADQTNSKDTEVSHIQHNIQLPEGWELKLEISKEKPRQIKVIYYATFEGKQTFKSYKTIKGFKS
ncbi:hypothetical protein [Metamycoplasma neophronis]|uniref:Uncharacterized protein n=1 Tax=Metamycoplasma neophronis TaxID=872983 RepID=A0ABY2Z0A2_9BACT|nr:hypothetical protein [Metamycoplasma neophronis]TPR53871.1 hypothetical protein FJR74_01760 [Metamycoplasma neophronis]